MNSENMPKVVGSINISHDVECPHCGEAMWDDIDNKWWNKNITDQLPSEEMYNSQFNVVCSKCERPFVVDGFSY